MSSNKIIIYETHRSQNIKYCINITKYNCIIVMIMMLTTDVHFLLQLTPENTHMKVLFFSVQNVCNVNMVKLKRSMTNCHIK